MSGFIEKLATGITDALKVATKIGLPSIPTLLLLCEIKEKPGMSAMILTSAIISRLPEIGIPTGPNANGDENINNKFIRIMSEEIVKHLKEYAKITNVVESSSIQITGNGGNAGGPVSINGTNVGLSKIFGGIS